MPDWRPPCFPAVPLRTTLWSPHRDHAMGCISFHRGGDWVAGSDSHGVTVWNVATGRVHAYRHDEDGFDGVHFGPDEGRVAIADEGRAIVWDWRNDKEQLFGGKPSQTASLAALSEDGKSVYVASGGKLTQWDLESRREHVLVDAGATGDYGYTFSADARRFAQADPEHTIRVWELPSLQIVATLDGPQTPGLKLAFSADGKTLTARAAWRTRCPSGTWSRRAHDW